MIWSFSSSRMFKHCQRQWFFKQHFANANAKKQPERREAYLLSTLQSIYAWRGSLVDLVLSTRLVPALNRGNLPRLTNLVTDARRLFDEQLTFAQANRMRVPGMSKTKAGNSFASLYNIEYELGLSDSEIQGVWKDIEDALHNLYSMQDFLFWLRDANHLIAQRPLTFTCHGVRARMVPDLVVIDADERLFVVDWKVHTFGIANARLQLASYALALVNCNPHKDFPPVIANTCATDIGLVEIQLLTKQQRYYTLSENDINAVESYIVQTNVDMSLTTDNRPKQFSPTDFPTATRAETCQRCNFRSLCWDDAK